MKQRKIKIRDALFEMIKMYVIINKHAFVWTARDGVPELVQP
jgi:hypothetical protein